MQCPYCLAEFEDRPGLVACPHCGNALPGRSWTEPETTGPAPQNAVMQEGPRPKCPWEEMDERGFLDAFLTSLRESLVHPQRFFELCRSGEGMGQPLLYAMFVGLLGGAIQVLWQALFEMSDHGQWMAEFMPMGYWVKLAILVLSPPAMAAWVMALALVYHPICLLLGGRGGGYEQTLRVLAYSQGTTLFGVLPFCGSVIGITWGAIITIIGFSVIHAFSRAKATLAVTLPSLLCICVTGGAILVFFSKLVQFLEPFLG